MPRAAPNSQHHPSRPNGAGTVSGWAILQEHRRHASAYPLNVLVWGPGADGGREYRARCKLRDKLTELGHDAKFSEELCVEPDALADPMNDEHLQAEAAQIIVMIYGSRGTQTERDFILTDRELAQKAIILVEKQLYETIRKRSLAGKSWEEMGQVARIIVYRKSERLQNLVDKVCKITQQIRTALYVRDLRRKVINGR